MNDFYTDEMVACYDCGKVVSESEAYHWTWYDFSPREGDKPLTLCVECKNNSAHTKRVMADRENYLYEMEG